jgi:long-chain acyl-CoA synthetase
VPLETIPQLVLGNGRRLGSAPAYWVRGSGAWEATSWEGYAAEVRQAGAAFVALGLEPGQAVAILGANRPEWVIGDVAAMAAGAVPAGIYATSSPAECAYILNHSEAPVLLVENEDQWLKIASVRDQLPHLRHVVGTYLDTSGTTGRPKAVMLTHDNLTWTASQAADLAEAGPSDRLLSYLPLSHVAEQMFTIHIAAVTGVPVYYAESIDKLLQNLGEVKPTLFFGVPRVWEKFHAGVLEKLAENTGVKAKLVEQATAVGRTVTTRTSAGLSVSFPDAARFKVFDKLVYSKVKDGLGLSEARLCVSGAAPVSKEILEFFAGFGLPIYEVYGQSEDCGPTTFNVPGRTKFGTVGPAFPGLEVKVAADGEIIVRGRNVFAGYARDPEATAEALADGWLHTGDLGEFDAEGFLTITGRKKDIIITAGGKNVAPTLLEGGLRNHPLVSEAVVIGDRRKFLSALVTLDGEAAARYQKERDLFGPPEQSEEIRREIQQVVDALNTEMARVEQIKRFTILPRELSIAEGELTPTLKVKRNVVTAHFEAEIEAMYADS